MVQAPALGLPRLEAAAHGDRRPCSPWPPASGPRTASARRRRSRGRRARRGRGRPPRSAARGSSWRRGWRRGGGPPPTRSFSRTSTSVAPRSTSSSASPGETSRISSAGLAQEVGEGLGHQGSGSRSDTAPGAPGGWIGRRGCGAPAGVRPAADTRSGPRRASCARLPGRRTRASRPSVSALLERVEREQRALEAGRADLDAQQVEDVLVRPSVATSSSGLPRISSVSMRGRGLADGAAAAGEGDVADDARRRRCPSISVMRSPHSGLRALEGGVRLRQRPEVVRAAGSARGSRRGRGRPWWSRTSIGAERRSAHAAARTERGCVGADVGAVPRPRVAAGCAQRRPPGGRGRRGGVDVEAGARRGGLAEALVERLRAVVAGADRDGLAVEERGHVVGVDVRQVERHDAGPLVRGRAARRCGCPAPRAAGAPARTASASRSWARTASMPSAAR